MRTTNVILNRAPLVKWSSAEGGDSEIKVFIVRQPNEDSEGKISTRKYGQANGRHKIEIGDTLETKNCEKFRIHEMHLSDSGGDDDGLWTLELESL